MEFEALERTMVHVAFQETVAAWAFLSLSSMMHSQVTVSVEAKSKCPVSAQNVTWIGVALCVGRFDS